MWSQRRRALVLVPLLLVAPGALCAQPAKPVAPIVGAQTENKVRDIRQEAKLIDRAVDAPRESGLTLADKNAGKWELSGAFKNGIPVYLLARFLEGNLVREESYYFRSGQLVLARIEKSWDVDDGVSAPGPDSRREFYFQQGLLLRQTTHIDSKPPVNRVGDFAGPTDWLADRSAVISKILLGNSPLETIESLNDMAAMEKQRR